MSYLVFYWPICQTKWPRRKGGYDVHTIHSLRTKRIKFEGADECVVFPRYAGPNGRRLREVIVFDESTTPPTLVRMPLGRESGSLIVAHRDHVAMPRMYVNQSGDIVRSHDGSVVMDGNPWEPPAK